MILLGQGADRHGMRIQGHIHHFTAHISKIGVRGECLSQHAVDISQHVRRDKTRPGDQQHKHALVRVVLVRKPATLARGQGTLTAPDGGQYEGQFYEGMNMGRARLPFPGKAYLFRERLTFSGKGERALPMFHAVQGADWIDGLGGSRCNCAGLACR